MEHTAGEVADLLRRARAYDRDAFSRLYGRTVGPVYRYLSARVAAREDVEELTQEVFLAALRGIQSLRAEDEASLLAWLFQIARYKLADHLRRRYRQPGAPLDDAADMESPRPGPDDLAELEEEHAAVRQALEQLTPEQREVMVCKYVLGYDNERTARLVGKNANAVNQLHHRALASLHRLLTRTPERTR